MVVLAAIIYLVIVYLIEKYAQHLGFQVFLANTEYNFLNPVSQPWASRDLVIYLISFTLICVLSFAYFIFMGSVSRINRAFEFDRVRFLIFLCLSFILITTANINVHYLWVIKKYFYFFSVFLVTIFILIRYDLFLKFIHNFYVGIKLYSRQLAWILILFSFLQRIVPILLFDPHILRNGDDPKTFFDAAVKILNFKKPPPVLFSCLMPYFLVIVFSIFGIHILPAKIILTILLSFAMFFVYKVAIEIFQEPCIGIFSLIYFIINNHIVYFSFQLWNENLFLILLIFYIYFLVLLVKYNQHLFKLTFILSLLTALMTLARTWAILFLAIYAICVGKNKKCLLLVFFHIAMTLMFIFPHSFFESMAHHRMIFVSDNASYNFNVGNNPLSQGCYTRHFIKYSEGLKDSPDSFEVTKNILAYNFLHPLQFFILLTKKILLWFFGAPQARPISIFYSHPLSQELFYFRIIMSILTLFFLFHIRNTRYNFLTFLFILITLIHVIFFVDYRFTIMIAPFQALAFGYYAHKALRYIDQYKKY